ncbi:MAG: sigma-70 family RNA polymerase sigma factor [Planctomycetota bacterium]|nr:MAG: sigma-70 family RNA polymerase sigma factor [Planctomycetota bacterium]
MAERSDSSLVEDALNGDGDSFTELCRRYYPAMVAIAHSILGDRHLGEDAAQQTFANAVHKLPQLKNTNRFAYWLAAICRNVARDMTRTAEKLNTVQDLSMVAVESDQDELTDVVRGAIGELSVAARELVYLRYYDGMSYHQMSAVLGISEQAINGRLRRAKKKIAAYLRRNGIVEVRS